MQPQLVGTTHISPQYTCVPAISSVTEDLHRNK